MISIEERANNDKYFNSIKFYYHNSTPEKKLQIFNELLNCNIYLAAHCISTDFPNILFETQAVDTALKYAKEFQDEISSSKALLALAELKQYSQISEIFNSVETPRKIHYAVLNRVFQQADEETFLILINSFSEYRHLKTIGISFLQYPHKLNLTQNVLYTLQKFILKLYQENAVGLLRAFLEKFELYDFVGFFFGRDVTALAKELVLKKGKYAVLAYYIIKHFNYFRIIGLDFLITAFSSKDSEKSLRYSLQIALEYEVYTNETLNRKLTSVLHSSASNKKSSRNKKVVKRLINFTLTDYIEHVETLVESYLNFCYINGIRLMSSIDYETLDRDTEDNISYFDNNLVDAIIKLVTNVDSGSVLIENPPLTEFWHIYFNSTSPLIRYYPIEPVLERVKEIYKISFRELFKVVRNFQHFGILQNVIEAGGYIVPVNFRSIKLLFVHKEQTIDLTDLESEVGNQLSFYMIGYNFQTKRINTSTLDIEKIIENGIMHEAKQAK